MKKKSNNIRFIALLTQGACHSDDYVNVFRLIYIVFNSINKIDIL